MSGPYFTRTQLAHIAMVLYKHKTQQSVLLANRIDDYITELRQSDAMRAERAAAPREEGKQ